MKHSETWYRMDKISIFMTRDTPYSLKLRHMVHERYLSICFILEQILMRSTMLGVQLFTRQQQIVMMRT